MGYTTEFSGSVKVEPPLTSVEAAFLHQFARTRHCVCQDSKYAADGLRGCPPGRGNGCRGSHPGNPGYWCNWVPGEPVTDGYGFAAIEWDGGEKFDDSVEWMRFIVDEFLKPGSAGGPQSGFLTRDHVLNGVIEAQGEEMDDRWRLVVRDNIVTEEQPQTIWASDQVREIAVVPGEVVRERPELESGR
jgi:hypothetical protein